MLGVKSYTREYIDDCRSKVEQDLAAYTNLIAAVRNKPGGENSPDVETFEATFFSNMVLVLDALFVHRLRTVEGKDGNALNEVRVICNSIMNNKGVMTAEKAIKLSPADSVLKYQIGDQIKLNEADFRLILEAFFVEIESKFA